MRTLRRSPPPPPPHGDRRRDAGVEPDRISALPDEMLLLVLARLRCVRAAVQTSLLSRRWRGLWTGLTDLAFRRLAPATIEAVLARFARSSEVSLCDVAQRAAAECNSLLRSAARLSPGKLDFTILQSRADNGAIELPCLTSTTSIELHTHYLCVKPTPAGEFTALERLSISGRVIDLGDLLNRCPRLRVFSLRDATLDVVRVAPPPIGEFTALENLSLTGRIDGLNSLLNRCRHLRVLSITYTHAWKLTLPSNGEFPVLEKLSLSGNITDLGSSLNRCPRLRVLSVTFRSVALDSIEASLATLGEVVRLGLALCLLDISDICNKLDMDGPRFTSLLRAAARALPQEFTLKHLFHGENSIDLPSFQRTTSIDMDLNNTSICFGRIPEDFSALQRLSLSGGCRFVNLATMVSRCKRLRELTVTVTNGKIKVHSESLQKLYASTGWHADCRSIDIVAPMLKQMKLVVRDGGDISVSISAPTVEHVRWKRLNPGSTSMRGLWRLRCLRLETAQDTCLFKIQCLRISAASKPLGVEMVFTKEMEKLLITDFSMLELRLENTLGHLFGALVLRLFAIHRIRVATKRLKVTRCDFLLAIGPCPVTCPCNETNDIANQNISSTCLEEVEMVNFSGDECEHDFLTRILGCSPMLKRVSLNLTLYGTFTKEVEDIFLAYPSVSCYVYYSSGKLAQCISG